MKPLQEIKVLRRELELINAQLRHATTIELNTERIKTAVGNLEIQINNLAKIEKEISKKLND
ncbi:MAG: hypothetical protein ACOC2U_04600 [bacterium]